MVSPHEKVIEFKMGEPERHYRVTLRKAGDHSVQLVSLHPGMLTGVNVHTQEWVDAIRQALLIAGDSRQWPASEK
jgi:hypothetical protein